MELTIRRIARRPGYTIGRLYIGGQRVCDTLEDTDRGLDSRQTTDEIAAAKVRGRTSIPTGHYAVYLATVSPRFSTDRFYKDTCGGCPPRLARVPGFDGILIHCGNTAEDTEGCILVGENRQVGKVLNSRDTFRRLMEDWLTPARKRGEQVYITIE